MSDVGNFTCPECGKVLNPATHDVEAHARTHWNVPYKHVDRLRNTDAQNRYHALMTARDEAIAAIEAAETQAEESTSGTSGTVDVIEGDL